MAGSSGGLSFERGPNSCGFSYSQWGYFEYSHGRARAELGRQVERAQQRLVTFGLGCGHSPTPSTHSGGARWGAFQYSLTLGDSEYSHTGVVLALGYSEYPRPIGETAGGSA